MLTAQFKIIPSAEQLLLLDATCSEYISLINDIVDYADGQGQMPKLSSANLKASLPSALKDQCRLDAASVFKKTQESHKAHVLKKPIAVWNNQNYKITDHSIKIPVWIKGKCKQIEIEAAVPKEIFELICSHKCGTLRLSRKNGKYIAQIAYYPTEEKPSESENTMGVDLGIKCPAVAHTHNGKTKFFGNGRQNKYYRRHQKQRRKKLGKAKKMKALRKVSNKESRYMTDQDHKISRGIVNFAVKNNVGLIKLEKLSNIRSTTRTSRKNNHSLHNWSFYRLASFIQYKAQLKGISVAYVNPAYTSQTCPKCGSRNHAKDRNYVCSNCGYHCHRDIVGSINIDLAEPELFGSKN